MEPQKIKAEIVRKNNKVNTNICKQVKTKMKMQKKQAHSDRNKILKQMQRKNKKKQIKKRIFSRKLKDDTNSDDNTTKNGGRQTSEDSIQSQGNIKKKEIESNLERRDENCCREARIQM